MSAVDSNLSPSPATVMTEGFPRRSEMRCRRCLAQLPYSLYEPGADAICYACRLQEAEEQIEAYKKKEGTELRTIIKTELIDAPHSLEHISECVQGLVHHFGGMHNFCKTWYEQIMLAMENHPGGRLGLENMRAIAKLWFDCSKLQHQESIDQMNDTQLRNAKEQAIQSILMDAGVRAMMMRLMEAHDEQDITMSCLLGVEQEQP